MTESVVSLMTLSQVAEVLGVSPATVKFWRTRGQGPKAIRIGKWLRYRPEDVTAWIDQQAKAS